MSDVFITLQPEPASFSEELTTEKVKIIYQTMLICIEGISIPGTCCGFPKPYAIQARVRPTSKKLWLDTKLC